MVLLTRGRSQDRPQNARRAREITAGCTVVVLNGRHFMAFGAGDEGVVLRVDHEAQNCDVLFSGKSGSVPVALRHLRAKSPAPREGAAGRDAQAKGDWDDVATAIVDHRLPRTAEDCVFDAMDTDHNNVISREELKDAIKAGIIEDGNTVVGVSVEGEEVSMVCAAELSGASEGWPGANGLELPTAAANADGVAGEDPEGSPASLNGRGSSQAHMVVRQSSGGSSQTTDLPQLGTPPCGLAQQSAGLKDGNAAGFAAGVAALNAAAAAAAAEAAAAVNSTALPNGVGARVGQITAVQAALPSTQQAKILDIHPSYIACGPPAGGVGEFGSAMTFSTVGDLGGAVALSGAPQMLSVNNGFHVDPNVRLCDTSSISAHSEAPPSMGYSLAATAAGYHVAAPTPGWGLEVASTPVTYTAPAVLSEAASVGGCVTPFTGVATTSPPRMQSEVNSLRHALEECVQAISTCANIIDALRSEAVSADLRRRAGLQANPQKSEESKQADLHMVTLALQKAADLGAQVLISTAPVATSTAASAAVGPAVLSSRSMSVPRTMARAASCSGFRQGRSAATPVNVEVIGQQDLSMSVPEMSAAHRARSGSPTLLGAGARRYLVATPNGKSDQHSLMVVPGDLSGASMSVPSSRQFNGSVTAPCGGPALASYAPPMGYEASSPPLHARYGPMTPTRHRSMTPGGATPTAPMPPPHMQPSPQGVLAGCWGSAAAPVQMPGAPGPGPGMMPPSQPLSPTQWMPTDTSMMNVSGSLLGPAGMPGAMPGPPGIPSAASFAVPGGPPGGPPAGLPPAGGAFNWPTISMGPPPMASGPPGMTVG